MADLNEIINQLNGALGQQNIKSDADSLAEYTVDGIKPKVVVFPKNSQECSDVVKIANKAGLGVIPWGAGTMMASGNIPKKYDIAICMLRMNHMLEIDTSNLVVTVEAGVRLRDLQARLATEDDRCYLPLTTLAQESEEFICSDRSVSGCFLPIDPMFSDKTTIGGMIATNGSGPKRVYYTLPRDLVIGTKFIDPEGNIVKTGGRTVKNVSGYDVSKLLLGSYGSLGIVTEATIRLQPLPENVKTLVAGFDSLDKASSFATAFLKSKMLPAAVEVMNDTAYNAINLPGKPALGSSAFVVALAFEHFVEAVERMVKEGNELAVNNGATAKGIVEEDLHGLFWLRISDIIPAKNTGDSISLKLNYPVSCYKDIMGKVDSVIKKDGLKYSVLTHSGNGITLLNIENASKAVGTVKSILKYCLEAEGNLMVLAAPTALKESLPIWGETGSDFVLIKRLKDKMDPSGVMCFGRYVGGL